VKIKRLVAELKSQKGGKHADAVRLKKDRSALESRHVWMTPADQGLFSGVALIVGAVMSSASFVRFFN
jgi:hypothetical protein